MHRMHGTRLYRRMQRNVNLIDLLFRVRRDNALILKRGRTKVLRRARGRIKKRKRNVNKLSFDM